MARLANLLQMVAAKSTAHEHLSFSLLLRPTNECPDDGDLRPGRPVQSRPASAVLHRERDDGRQPSGAGLRRVRVRRPVQRALLGRPLQDLSPEERADFIARFEHKVSDHMPLWIRLPLPVS